MSSFTSRSYSVPQDLQLIINFLCSVRPGERLADYPGISDLREVLSLTAVQANTRLWFSRPGLLAAFAFVDSFSNLWFETAPSARGGRVEGEIFQWGVGCARRLPHLTGEVPNLDGACRSEDPGKVAFFKRYGFVRQPVRTFHLARDLSRPVPAPELPSGYRIRPLAGTGEVDALVLLHRLAFGTDYMTVEERLASMSNPDYTAELDLVVEAPAGGLAGYCQCSIPREENRLTGVQACYTDPIAVHPDHQRKGLARAMLLEGMRLLKERGMLQARLGASSENDGMIAAAQAAGYRVKDETIWFSRRL